MPEKFARNAEVLPDTVIPAEIDGKRVMSALLRMPLYGSVHYGFTLILDQDETTDGLNLYSVVGVSWDVVNEKWCTTDTRYDITWKHARKLFIASR